MATTTQIMAWAIAGCGNRDDITSADQLALYNRTQRMVNRSANLNVMRVLDKTTMDTVDGAYEITLPADCKSIKTLRLEDDTQSRKLIRVTPQWMDRQHAKPDGSGHEARPTHYCKRGASTIYVWPVPDAAYDLWIDYYKWFSDQAADTDTNFTNMDDVLVEGLKFHIWSHVGEEAYATVALAKFHVLLDGVVNAEQEKMDLEFEAEPFVAGGRPVDQGHLDPWVTSV